MGLPRLKSRGGWGHTPSGGFGSGPFPCLFQIIEATYVPRVQGPFKASSGVLISS